MPEYFSSSESSGNQNEEDFNVDAEDVEFIPKAGQGSTTIGACSLTAGTLSYVDSLKTMTPADFGTKFQDLVIRALLQSTGSSNTSCPIEGSLGGVGVSGHPVLSNGECSNPSTWNEAAYNKAKAQQKRKPPLMRTSAGEDSDSQEDFPIPENESPQEKSVRTRRLNRSRMQKANELTCNRKAMKMLPYVIHIDGTGRAKGTHKHLWRAAVRGQCGRLDPTMDNLNHHPQHVVNSIWNALEKEWEFIGFAHRARSMFERQAMRFMRNRKMQLKNKCKKLGEKQKPTDVNDLYWKKIVNLTKESSRRSQSTILLPSTAVAIQEKSEVEQDRDEMPLQIQVRLVRWKSYLRFLILI